MLLVLNRILHNHSLQLSLIKVTVEQINLFRAFKETARFRYLKLGKGKRTERTIKGLSASLGFPSLSLFLRGGSTWSISCFSLGGCDLYVVFICISLAC